MSVVAVDVVVVAAVVVVVAAVVAAAVVVGAVMVDEEAFVGAVIRVDWPNYMVNLFWTHQLVNQPHWVVRWL